MAIVIGFIRDLVSSRSLIWQLAKRDYRQSNQGSYLGIVWNYLQPIVFIAVLYFVFTYGLRAGHAGDMPFVLYLVGGIICWQYFAAYEQYLFLLFSPFHAGLCSDHTTERL